MKRFLSLAMSALLVASLAVSASAAVDGANAKTVKAEIKAAAETPKQDGVIGEYEYVKVDTSLANLSYSDDSVKDYTFDLYLSYDKDYVYYALKTEHEKHTNERDDDLSNLWNADGIQIASALASVTEANKTERTEIGYGLSSKTGKVLSNMWLDTINGGKTCNWAPSANDCVITVDKDGTAIYEGKLPAAFFGASSLKKGDSIRFSIAVNTFVSGARQYIEYGIGTCASKDGSAHPVITLGDAIEIPVSAPATADATSVAVAALAASLAAGFVVVKSKKH